MVASKQVKGTGSKPITVCKPVRLPMPVISGAVTVAPLNLLQSDGSTIAYGSKRVKLKLWHKNADILKRRRKKPLPNTVVSFDYAVTEPDRKLCAIPARDGYASRNDRYRIYHWATIKP